MKRTDAYVVGDNINVVRLCTFLNFLKHDPTDARLIRNALTRLRCQNFWSERAELSPLIYKGRPLAYGESSHKGVTINEQKKKKKKEKEENNKTIIESDASKF